MRIRFNTARPPQCLFELQLSAQIVYREETYLQLAAAVRNVGGGRQSIEQEGTRCQVLLVKRDLSESTLLNFPVFQLREAVAPGETAGDLKLLKLPLPPDEMVWVRVNLRVVSAGTEWNASCVVPVGGGREEQPLLPVPLLVNHGSIAERKGLTLQIERQKKEQNDQDRRIAPGPRRGRDSLSSRLAPRATEQAASLAEVE